MMPNVKPKAAKGEFLYLEPLLEYLEQEHEKYMAVISSAIVSEQSAASHNIAVGALGMISFVRATAQQLSDDAMNGSDSDV